ncbi:TM2 domain-containing protein [Flavobacterium sp. UBA6135]|uniref:TM2 domain-containing protein n=1 Tax=Flavobacterium sp. UBA6135 TaxID=1946553 RepID=UPI0025C2FF03|nr:NINE protein [Flavobacterium sp. UBA6135]
METSKPREEWNTPKPSEFQPAYRESKKIAAGITAILLGGLGVHKFILGYTNEGVIMLMCTIFGVALSCFIFPIFIAVGVGIVSLIEGIIYLTKTDEEFYQTYQANKRPWF